ncbi:hypothetical protein FE257_011915 [Aspergillus nanangensis]|uniref:Complex 1 LYR protein domain-containing protein n=1 Tax=Aspergillus nanangensis TaxID=2582783 RepID=A0AAD4CH22_ASPNN|nr:hypothetical protein FE257_011915 [Aspergillus nanangensis]
MARLSGLQRDVLSLYRKCLREIRKKPIVSVLGSITPTIKSLDGPWAKLLLLSANQDTRGNFKSYARAEFEKYISVSKKDFNAIEYLLRKGQRQLEMYSSPGIRNIR